MRKTSKRSKSPDSMSCGIPGRRAVVAKPGVASTAPVAVSTAASGWQAKFTLRRRLEDQRHQLIRARKAITRARHELAALDADDSEHALQAVALVIGVLLAIVVAEEEAAWS